jgi:3-phosphoshikimate 1-carboxyvinyltransferase
MLTAMGASLEEGELGSLRLLPLERDLAPLNVRVSGDFSAAAFWLVAAALHPDAALTLKGVGLNPTRTGLFDVLMEMGANIDIEEERTRAGEPAADIMVRSTRLRGVTVDGSTLVRLIDEVPVLALAAALAEGRTVLHDVGELRVKESDRVKLTVQELRRLGARIDEEGEALVIEGTGRLTGAVCDSHGDHRLAMALGVAGLVAEGETVIKGAEATDVSYPGFWHDLDTLAGSG